MRWLRLGTALCALLVAASSSAHTPGLSSADFSWSNDGHLDAVFVFSALENASPFGAPSAVGQGAESPGVAPDALWRRLVTEDVVVRADGRNCKALFLGADMTEGDAIRIQARYECGADTAHLEAVLYYLNRMTHGHRQVVRMVAGDSAVEKVLGNTSRLIELDVKKSQTPPSPRSLALPRSRDEGVLVAALLISAVAGLGLLLRVRK